MVKGEGTPVEASVEPPRGSRGWKQDLKVNIRLGADDWEIGNHWCSGGTPTRRGVEGSALEGTLSTLEKTVRVRMREPAASDGDCKTPEGPMGREEGDTREDILALQGK